MIKATHNRRWELFFKLYSRIYMGLLFKDIRYITDEQTNLDMLKSRSSLIVANHFSFWDGFIQMLWCGKLLKKRIFIMMLYQQLVKFPFLKYGGCFSLNKGRKEVVESLNYGIDILSDFNNALLIFPQGRVESLYTQSYIFESGVSALAKRSKDAAIIFNINLINYFSNRRASLNIYLKEYCGERDLKSIESSFNSFADECKKREDGTLKGVKL